MMPVAFSLRSSLALVFEQPVRSPLDALMIPVVFAGRARRP